MASSPIVERYYATFKGKAVELRNFDKRLIRKFIMDSEVVNAQVQGAGKETYVAIVTKNGKTYLYRSDGRLIRK